MLGRLFQCFQQRIETVTGKHVHLIDQVDLVAPARRGVGNVFEQFSRLFHFGARCGIDFDKIKETPRLNILTGATLATGTGADPIGFAIQAFGEDASNGGLANSTHPCKQISMMQSVCIQRVGKRTQHWLLAEHVAKVLRPPFARKYLVAHV